jgi:hypothetical protein
MRSTRRGPGEDDVARQDNPQIVYHPNLEEAFAEWASECGFEPRTLRELTADVLRRRRWGAYVEHECHRANGRQPTVFTLRLRHLSVYFTDEAEGLVVRGYGWELQREPLDDFDGGGFYCEPDWHRPASDSQ